MTNRKKIEHFCKKNNIIIHLLEFIRNRDAEYGNTFDASYWELNGAINNISITYNSYYGYDSVNEDVDIMLSTIDNEIKTGEVFQQ